MSYLLDKVVARHIVRSLLKQSKGEALRTEEKFASDMFKSATGTTRRLFIVSATANILLRLSSSPEHTVAIRHFLDNVEVAKATPYFKRWARRLRGYNFTREDANVIALATFGTDQKGLLFGMELVVTQDQPMITNWQARHKEIQKHLDAMISQLPSPYNEARLPNIWRPEEIIF